MSEKLIQNLLKNIPNSKLLETHISWIILTGEYAYKIKKPVDFEFVDYTSLEKRFHYCREELRLNQQLAPEIYLEVVGIYGDEETPRFEQNNDQAIEYAVKMREFAQHNLLNELAKENKLNSEMLSTIAKDMARFHQLAAICSKSLLYGSAEQILEPVIQNFDQIRPMLTDENAIPQIDRLEKWAREEHSKLFDIIQKRKADGMVRECHGDIHLGNIVMVKDKPIIFDCIEFNESFRWLDVIADMAFLAMDLTNHDQPELSNLLVNTYLQHTGDYLGLAVLRFYQAYRAIVRAKITLFHLQQPNLKQNEILRLNNRYQSCFDLADVYRQTPKKWMAITHGVSSSGKSTMGRLIAKQTGAIHIRSDVERKRLYGLDIDEKSTPEFKKKLYSEKANARTHNRLESLAEEIISYDYPVIVDATFLKAKHRDQFAKLAKKLDIPFMIIHTDAPKKQLLEWIKIRQESNADPSEANAEILENQLKYIEPLTASELNRTISLNCATNTLEENTKTAVSTIIELDNET